MYRSGFEDEQLELEVGPDVVGRDETQDAPTGQPLDLGDEAMLHRLLKRAARLVDRRR